MQSSTHTLLVTSGGLACLLTCRPAVLLPTNQVATKRVKHAIKSDIPSVADHISKLLHVGKATVDKLVDLRAAFVEEGEQGGHHRVEEAGAGARRMGVPR